MRLSGKRKLFICLLGLAVSAFVAERVFFDAAGPEEALATPRVPSAEAAPSAAAAFTPPAEDPLSARLEELSKLRLLGYSSPRDPFCLCGAWAAQRDPEEVAAPRQDKARQLEHQHRLMAVMVQPGGGWAVVDGKCLFVGQEMDGIKLIALSEGSAVLSSGGVRFALELDRDAGKPPQP